MWKNFKNDASDCLHLASLDKLTEDMDSLSGKSNQLLTYQNVMNDNSEYSVKSDILQMNINSVIFLEETFLFSSHRQQIAEN